MLLKLLLLSSSFLYLSNIYASSLDEFSKAAKSEKGSDEQNKEKEKKRRAEDDEKGSFCLFFSEHKEYDDMVNYTVRSEDDNLIILEKSEKITPIKKDEESLETNLFVGVSSIIPISDNYYSWSFNLEALIVKSFGLYIDYTFFQENSVNESSIAKINYFDFDITKSLYYSNGYLVLLYFGYYGMYDVDYLHYVNLDFKLEKSLDPVRIRLKFGVGLDPDEGQSLFKVKGNIAYTIKSHFEPFVGVNYRFVLDEEIGGVEAGMRFVF